MKHIVYALLFIVLAGADLVAQSNKAAQPLSFEAFEQKLAQTPSPQVLDVRSPQEFAENHLKDAVNFNVPDDAAFAKEISLLNKQKPVFVYSINNGRSGVISEKLRNAGFVEVYPLPGGIAHWIGAGRPIESSASKGLSVDDYNKLLASDNVILVDIGSKHCGGCKKLEPVVDAISKEQAVKLVKIDLYDNRQLVKTLAIESVPTLILYKGGKPIWKKSGAITNNDIQDALDQSL
jgi:rhodanese-related sulfurtransferase